MAIKLVIKQRGDAPDAPPLVERVLREQLITLGSDTTATVPLNGAGIDPEQAVISNRNGEILLINSAERTMLNGEALPRAARRLLKHGDTLGIGNYDILVLSHDTTDPAAQRSPAPGVRHGRDESDPQASAAAPPVPSKTAQTRATPPVDELSPRNFAAILDSMRTEEDRFYFLIQGGSMNGRRIPLESEETLLGWDASGQALSFAETATPRALVRKNWRGEVTVEAQMPGMVAVNGVLIDEPRNLQNGDRVSIAPTPITNLENIAQLIFHEPASLAAIGALFPHEIPEPVTTATGSPAPSKDDGAGQTATGDPSVTTLVPAQPATLRRGGVALPERKYFHYFTAGEMLLFALATLLIAVVVFLALEFL